jgi:hypothetical protein
MSTAGSLVAEVEDLLRLEVFAPHLNADFDVRRGTEWVSVKLTEAQAAAGHRPVAGEKFSLIFSGGREKPLQQGIHEFEHESLGAFELFITPIMSALPDQRLYQAVINREKGHVSV